MSEHIEFHHEDIDFQPEQAQEVKQWIADTVAQYGQDIEAVTYIFCTDEYLHKINMEYLQHDTYTDIITFDNREDLDGPLESDIFLSVERVRENAQEMGIPFQDELHRVMIHGILHLLGYDDHEDEDEAEMRALESEHLAERKFVQ